MRSITVYSIYELILKLILKLMLQLVLHHKNERREAETQQTKTSFLKVEGNPCRGRGEADYPGIQGIFKFILIVRDAILNDCIPLLCMH